MISISPSIVASYEYWRDRDFDSDEDEQARYAELVAQIQGAPFRPTADMLIGRAWHAALDGEGYRSGDLHLASNGEGDDVPFLADEVRWVRSHIPDGAIREALGTLALPELGVVMNLRADAVEGVVVHEIKTASRVDADRYLGSVQWRCYLLAFAAAEARYHVCRLLKGRGDQAWRLREYWPMSLYRYPEMRDDVLRRVAEVRDFIVREGLSEFRRATVHAASA